MRLPALLVLGCCLAAARAEEEVEGEDAQEVTAYAQAGVGNDEDDVAVAGIWHDNSLIIAATTTGFLEVDANFGGIDIVIRSFDSNLEEIAAVQYGGDGDDEVKAMAGDSEIQLNIVIVGSTTSEEDHLFDLDTATGETDWFIAELDSSTLEVTNQYVNGTQYENQQATAVGIDLDGEGYYVAGWCWGEYFEENAGSDANTEDTIGYDWWVLKINKDLDDYEWTAQYGTKAYDEPSAIVVGSAGVFVVGSSTDNDDILDTDAEENIPAMFVYCLDGDSGETIWVVDDELGFVSDGSQAHGAVLNEAGTELFVAGTTRGTIPGYDGEATDTDELFVVAIDTDDGTVNWIWQSESNATAFGTAGVVMADDGVSPIVAGTAFGNQFNLTYTYWQSGSGDMIAAKINPDDLEVTKYFVAAAASTDTREDAYAIVKDPNEVDGVFLIGQTNGDFIDEEVEPETTSNYLVLQVTLETLPEEEEDEDTGKDYPYWYIGVPLYAVGGILFVVAYKWAEASAAAKLKRASQV